MNRKSAINNALGYTQRIHDNIAIPRFYDHFGFTNVKSEVGTLADFNDGIDYTALLANQKITIQERFRQYKYKDYGDITFRYDSKNSNLKREFFKIKAGYFLYGVVNFNETDFEWAAFVDVDKIINHILMNNLSYEIRENKGKNDSRFIAIKVSDIINLDPESILMI